MCISILRSVQWIVVFINWSWNSELCRSPTKHCHWLLVAGVARTGPCGCHGNQYYGEGTAEVWAVLARRGDQRVWSVQSHPRRPTGLCRLHHQATFCRCKFEELGNDTTFSQLLNCDTLADSLNWELQHLNLVQSYHTLDGLLISTVWQCRRKPTEGDTVPLHLLARPWCPRVCWANPQLPLSNEGPDEALPGTHTGALQVS